MKRLLGSLLAVALSAGCGGDSTPTAPPAAPTPTPATKSTITVTFEPNPVIAQASGNVDFPWKFSVAIIITETAGVACNVNLFTTTYLNPATGAAGSTRQYTVADVQRLSTTNSNFIPARGSLRLNGETNYTSGTTARAVNVRHVFQVIDANGNIINAEGTLPVT